MLATFLGQYEQRLDDKGRVVLPSKLRDRIDPEEDGEGFVIAPAPEECLFLYTDNRWARLCEAQAELPAGSEELRMFQRQWHAGADPISVDKQGRILLPERQRSLVNIKVKSEIIFAGCYDRIEIWAKPAWVAALAAARSSFTHHVKEFLKPPQRTPSD